MKPAPAELEKGKKSFRTIRKRLQRSFPIKTSSSKERRILPRVNPPALQKGSQKKIADGRDEVLKNRMALLDGGSNIMRVSFNGARPITVSSRKSQAWFFKSPVGFCKDAAWFFKGNPGTKQSSIRICRNQLDMLKQAVDGINKVMATPHPWIHRGSVQWNDKAGGDILTTNCRLYKNLYTIYNPGSVNLIRGFLDSTIAQLNPPMKFLKSSMMTAEAI